MPELIYPTSKAYEAPWLIDYKKLEELDEIVDRLYNILIKYREERIQAGAKLELESEQNLKYFKSTREEIESKLRNNFKYSHNERSLRISLKNDKVLCVSSFKQAVKEQLIQEETPKGFSYIIEVGEVKFEIEMGKYNKDKLFYSVDSNSADISKDIIFNIERWIKDIKPPLWQRINCVL